MKKRILLSLVSFFAMTAMWASLIDAYQIYVTAAANGKTGATAELTLNMKNKHAIATWSCELVLPEGVTFESVEATGGRYPEGYNAEFNTVTNESGSVTIVCEGEDGVTLTGSEGAVAKVTVKIAADVTPGNYIVKNVEAKLTEPGEEPGIKGDLNGDGTVDIADAVSVLQIMAEGSNDSAADINGDGNVDIADFVAILQIMAGA